MVCLPRFNISTDLAPPPLEPFLPECGFCLACFQTLALNFEFLGEIVSRVNDTHLNFTCEVEVNVDFSVIWTIEIIDPETDDVERLDLSDRDPVEGGVVSIQADLVVLEDGTDFVITSVLIAPEMLIDMNVQCTAESPFGSESRVLNGDGNEI